MKTSGDDDDERRFARHYRTGYGDHRAWCVIAGLAARIAFILMMVAAALPLRNTKKTRPQQDEKARQEAIQQGGFHRRSQRRNCPREALKTRANAL